MPDLELLTVGRISVDLYAEQLRVPLRDVQTFRKSIGGTATNVAAACARLGHRAAVFTRVGDDLFGDYVRGTLERTFGVDTRFVGADPDLRTPLAFAEFRADVDGGRYPQPVHNVAVADDVYGQFVDYLDNVV